MVMKWLATGILLIQLVSCAKQSISPNIFANESIFPCKVRGACDATVIKSIHELHKSGIRVITLGQNYLISIPSSMLFEEQTPHLKWSSYGSLNQVASLLKQFRKVSIDITSFTTPYISVKRERALTLAQSRVVGEYLWSQGIDSRLIFTHGVTGQSRACKKPSSSMPARVEITFRDTIA